MQGTATTDRRLIRHASIGVVSVLVSGDNNPRGANETGQDPMLRLEAHLTKNLHQAV